MNDKEDFDALIARLKARPVERDLSGLDQHVWSRIDRRQSRHLLSLAISGGVGTRVYAPRGNKHIAAAALAVVIGLFVGILNADGSAPASNFSTFSLDAPYTPSSILR